jgi:hypothetical protein
MIELKKNASEKITVDYMTTIQNDVTTLLFLELKPFLARLPLGEELSPEVEWQQKLLEWDGSETTDSREALAFESWYMELSMVRRLPLPFLSFLPSFRSILSFNPARIPYLFSISLVQMRLKHANGKSPLFCSTPSETATQLVVGMPPLRPVSLLQLQPSLLQFTVVFPPIPLPLLLLPLLLLPLGVRYTLPSSPTPFFPPHQ